MTDDTRDRDRSFVDTGRAPEATSDGQAERASTLERADRTPAGTAEPTRTVGERTTPNRTTAAGPISDPSAERTAGSTPEPDAEPDDDRLEERLCAVERALTGTDDTVADLDDEASASAEREELSSRLDDLEARVEELEAATQALRGYVGSIRSVNQAVERRADLALAKASEAGDGGADENAIGDDASDGDNGERIGPAVPSEADLDAAVPTDRHEGNRRGPTDEPAVGGSEPNGENADDSWRDSALERLRGSL